MRSLQSLSILAITLFGLSACGGSDSKTASVSFSIADAPVDYVEEVWVTFESITLKDNNGNSNSQTLVITDSDGNPSPMLINLMDYQNGDRKLVIEGAEVVLGDYNLTLNTYGCAQSADGTGSTEHCWVVKEEGDSSIYPLKTPSNKLKLGTFSVSQEGNQAYTIEFNLRSALVNNGGGDNYNLKPHGVSIVYNAVVGSIDATVSEGLLNLGDGSCQTGSGNALYLYHGWHSSSGVLNMTLGDEFDPSVDTDVPADVLMPYASALISENENGYLFGNLPAGEYTLAFSCNDGVDLNGNSIAGDTAEFYDQILIANPVSQWTELIVSSGGVTEHEFTVSE